MADKSDYMKIASAQSLRISPKKEGNQESGDFYANSKRQDKEKNEQNQQEQKQLNELDMAQHIELGRLLLLKRNTEMRLFVDLKKEKPNEKEIIIIKNKLVDIESNLFSVGRDKVKETLSNSETDEIIIKIESIKELYDKMLALTEQEKQIILEEDDEQLELVINKKNNVLDKIDALLKQVDINYFKDFPPENENKIKVDAILIDIHYVMNMIVKIEDENSVNLQSVMDGISMKLTAKDSNAAAISKYALSSNNSHFIDTTK
ncbi:MAG TPA: hypothetical protein PL063_04235 [Candidatus Cloacimonadota bacterium]|jgi:hypothetical protein|nr:hypothetical protein [Candidatus Cloacimonadales bacterium]HPY96398.1 hypothetical protein [Candidatus Cloacimonadota bacterium]HQB41897.1 hypothetical protein [Candidatus Cloacimonadota bacterium]